MEKKSKKAQLEQLRGQFFFVGLIVSLSFAIFAFEWKTYGDGPTVGKKIIYEFEPPEIIPPTVDDIPKKPKPKLAPEIIPVDNDKETLEPDQFIIDAGELEEFNPEDFENDFNEELEDEPIFIAEVMPEFEGGLGAFMKYMAENIEYPRKARNLGVEGKVFVQFVVDKDGSLTNIELVRGVGAGCNEEAIRVIKESPKWLPGKQRGKPVRVKMVIPVYFQLN